MARTKLMKGHVWADNKHRATYPCAMEIKHDEIRCDITLDQGLAAFSSFAGKPLHNLERYQAAWALAMQHFKLGRIDTGVLVAGNFNDSYRYVRSSRGVPPNLANAVVEFILYDVPELGSLELDYLKRRKYMEAVADYLNGLGVSARLPSLRIANSEDEVIEYFAWVTARGEEGLMLKNLSHQYVPGKRTFDWLKVKPSAEADGLIVGVNQAVSIEGVPLPRVGSVDVIFEDGSKCSAAGIPHDLGAVWWADPEMVLNEWCVVKYMEIDRQGGYRHPSLVRLREAKE